MQIKLINLNYSENQYKFDLSALTEQDWVNFAHDIVLEKGDRAKNLELNGIKVVIRDNKAKIKLFYQDSSYHELEYHLDEFGRTSKNYQDIVSSLFQGKMSKYYGKEYDNVVGIKLNIANHNVQN